jgi:hypothetical protein
MNATRSRHCKPTTNATLHDASTKGNKLELQPKEIQKQAIDTGLMGCASEVSSHISRESFKIMQSLFRTCNVHIKCSKIWFRFYKASPPSDVWVS